MNRFTLFSPEGYKATRYYDYAIEISQKSNRIINELNTNTYNSVSLESFKDFLESPCGIKIPDITTDETNLDLLIFRIKLYELIGVSTMFDRFMKKHYQFEYFKPVIVPHKEFTSVNEEYTADLYINFSSGPYKFLVVNAGDTMQYGDKVPILKMKPERRGKNKLKYTILLSSLEIGEIPFECEYEYDVK